MTEEATVEMETVPCNLCGNREFTLLYRRPDEFYYHDDWFQVVACKSCGLGFVNPRPTLAAIQHYYPSDYFSRHFKTNIDRLRVRYERQAAYLKLTRGVAEEAPRLLDIGCANGDFPRFVRTLGWNVEGVEPADNVDSIDDFHCYRSLDAIPAGAPRYDAVTAWSVMEHVHDPMSVFAAAARLLKKGGVFLALTTNLDSLSSRYLFREDVPRHLYFFNRRTVAAYAAKTQGLVLEDVRSGSHIYEMAPLHWLRHFVRRAAGLPPLQWNDLPEIRYAYFERTGQPPTLANTLRYIVTHPFTVLDRALMPCYAKWQELIGTYGLVIYVLRKTGAE